MYCTHYYMRGNGYEPLISDSVSCCNLGSYYWTQRRTQIGWRLTDACKKEAWFLGDSENSCKLSVRLGMAGPQ
jgi:hypothetical protein